MQPIPSRDEELLRQHVASADVQSQLISDETAQTIARWFARSIGPGFQGFLASGLVTPEFYRELSYLYEQRRPDVEQWLNALVRYSLRQPTVRPADSEKEGGSEDESR